MRSDIKRIARNVRGDVPAFFIAQAGAHHRHRTREIPTSTAGR